MPGLDGTGPLGRGPMTGWGRGICGRGFGRGYSWRAPYTTSGAWPDYGATGNFPYGGNPYAAGPAYGSYGNPFMAPAATSPYSPQMTREQELDFLTNQAQAIKSQLDQINARITDLEKEKEQ